MRTLNRLSRTPHARHWRFFSVALALLFGCSSDATRSGDASTGGRSDAQSFWLENMVLFHGYTTEEVAAATGHGVEEIATKVAAVRSDEQAGRNTLTPPADRLLILPYPGGRHPRIGFLDGAIDPWRETKLSVFLPWKDAGYVVVDLPEALWRNRELPDDRRLMFLAHTHIPTIWDDAGVTLERRDWSRGADGTLENTFSMPNGVIIGAKATPQREWVDLELTLDNGSPERLAGLRTQICVMLKGAPQFNAQTNGNKQLEDDDRTFRTRYAAVRAAGAERWVVTLWTRSDRPWGNESCPCIHADPWFPDLHPGESATLRGRLFFHEGDGLDAAIKTHRDALDAVAPKKKRRQPRLVSVRKIWDKAPHNAFTDLIHHNGRWVCVFREGQAHVSPDGALRVLGSADGVEWESLALLTSETADLRDAKISVAPDGRLHLSGAGALHQPAAARHQSLAWFSPDGREWTPSIAIGDPDLWLWRTDWHSGKGYGIGYSTTDKEFIRLYETSDGANYRTLVDRLLSGSYANESSFAFLPDGRALCLLRRDGEHSSALLGEASPPYKAWRWRDLGVRFGGPKLLRLPDGRLIAGGRLYDGSTRTSLCWLDPEAGELVEALKLPSGGDTSYPGLVFRDGTLYVSYYASHEGKSAIYFATVEL